MSARSGGHDGLHKYPGHVRYRALDAHDGRNTDEVISRPKSARRPVVRRSAEIAILGHLTVQIQLLCASSVSTAPAPRPTRRVMRGGNPQHGVIMV
jgi:hypothetical protein